MTGEHMCKIPFLYVLNKKWCEILWQALRILRIRERNLQSQARLVVIEVPCRTLRSQPL